MNITPTHVTFEQAKLINYPFLTNTGYSFDGNILIREGFIATNGWINRPEQWQVVEWLRLEKNVWILVYPEMSEIDKLNWAYTIYKLEWGEDKEVKFENRKGYFNSPQEAYSAGFDYILNNNLI